MTRHLSNTRRFFLRQSAAALAAFALPASAPAQAPSSDGVLKNVSRDIALKFRVDGSARPFAGNTVICHLPQEGRLRDTVVSLNHDLHASTFARKLGILAPASLHMTIFAGAEDQERELWPSYVPPTAPMEVCTRLVLERMKSFRLNCDLPFRTLIDAGRSLATPGVGVIQLNPITAAEEKKLRTLRDRLSELYGFRAPDHASFGFHITVAYQLDSLTPPELAEYRRILDRRLPQLTSAAPTLELGLPEFCTFRDMNRFDIELLLNT